MENYVLRVLLEDSCLRMHCAKTT